MELGFDGVLLNSSVARSLDPVNMAIAMKYAVLSGRNSYLSGRISPYLFGQASSPKKGLI